MTEPLNPNRIGGVRGGNGTTLEDIAVILADIRQEMINANAGLVAIQQETSGVLEEISRPVNGTNAQLALLLTRLTFLTGTAVPPATGFGTTGLPGYLSFVLGARSQFTEVQESLWLKSANIELFISSLLNTLRPSPGVDNSDSYIRQIRELLSEPGEITTGTSLFRLLASIDTNVGAIEDCACDDDVTPPLEFPPPVAACLGQAAAYELCTLEFAVSISSTPPVDVWNVVWPSVSAGRSDVGIRSTTYPLSIPPDQTSHQLSYIGPTVEVGDNFEGCLAWNFEGDTNFITINSANHVNTAPYVSTAPLPPSLSNRASIAFSIPEPTTGSSFRGLAACVTVASGSVPQGKVYVQVVPLETGS